ncbi:hypothetical protein [Thiomicrorhabdus sp. 6S3-12]|uniref:hypothetical protein n=1 Tax=Thiomicrorhabdus sp. 6S3-12 TaxID=2819681 RepID=UPI001AAC723D|nr:hypothetical protein [Thiomicrorhabdus sp. 6S3-12]MBO1923776.1 hypothetical protein [Thiomicrorhabdus sp. 6S3-12]
MEVILNDLSLEIYGRDFSSLINDLLDLVLFNTQAKKLGSPLKCHRNVRNLFVADNKSLIDVIGKNASKDQRQKIFTWLDRSGPFWCESREENPDDYFELNGQDVTNRGLGECARKQIIDKPVASYSLGQEKVFRVNTLCVQHGLPEEILGLYEIQNYYEFESLKARLHSLLPPPQNWKDLISYSKAQFELLVFSDELLGQIEQLPFSDCVAERFLELCKKLEEIIQSRDEKQQFSSSTHQLIEQHFHGDKAWFSDESDQDKIDFVNQLKFKNAYTGEKESFSYHGKIKTPQIRVYFDWPLTPAMKQIQIVYFGPKITKH